MRQRAIERRVRSQPGGYRRSVSSSARRVQGNRARARRRARRVARRLPRAGGPDIRRLRQEVPEPVERARGRLVTGDDQRHDLVQQLAVGHRLAALAVARIEQERHDVVAAHVVAAPALDIVHDELAQLAELVRESKVARRVVGEERIDTADPSRGRSSPNSASSTTSSVASLMSWVTIDRRAASAARCHRRRAFASRRGCAASMLR